MLPRTPSTRRRDGVKVRTLYSAVRLCNGKTWDLEDLHVQSMEFGSGSGGRKN
jgi:hypothetical protein